MNIATIPSWEITAVKMFNATYMKCYRASVLTRKFDGSCEQISNQDLCQKILIHHPNAVRSVIRIRFLLFAPKFLVSLTAFDYSSNPERSWLGLVFSGLLWMRSKCFTLKDFPSPFDNFSPWREFILDKPAMFLLVFAATHLMILLLMSIQRT